ncbi:alpha/beta hydrolase [Streptomyces rhizosphaericus]|uniref:alpha/beta hydrolase n=1 Tax=Streptomyces rhizosphaericus TaxID=114699 RepID=UPI000A3CB1E9
MIFLHGRPGIGLIWRAQMDPFAADGRHRVAPDLRGYGGSSPPAANDAYTIKEVVADMAKFHNHLGGKTAIWVGHDWGSITVGALAAHEPDRCRGVVLTSWAYFPDANSLPTLVARQPGWCLVATPADSCCSGSGGSRPAASSAATQAARAPAFGSPCRVAIPQPISGDTTGRTHPRPPDRPAPRHRAGPAARPPPAGVRQGGRTRQGQGARR